MFSPVNQQIEIYLLKSNLEKIGNDLVVQNSAIPGLDANNEQKYRETMMAVRVARTLNAERERLYQENMKLSAKRLQLKHQCEDITEELVRAMENRDQLTDLLTREEKDVESLIQNYEDSLQEKADRFRETNSFYNEDVIRSEIKKVNNAFDEVEEEMRQQEKVVENLKCEFDDLKPDLPEDILVILGKMDVDRKVKEVTLEYEALCEKRDQLLKK